MTVDADDRQGHRPGRAGRDVLGPGLVEGRQEALRGRRLGRRGLRLRPRRRPALEPGQAHVPRAAQGGGRRGVAGLAVSADGKTLWAANVFGHTVARFDTEGAGKLAGEWPLGDDSYPYGLALDESKHRLYVSLWDKAEVAVIDTETGEVVRRFATEEHPNEMLLARGGKVLYVANANRNTVSVCDTEAGKAVEVIGTAIDPRAPAGCTPSSLALSPDGSVLFVANANTNNLAVVNVKEVGGSTPAGVHPDGLVSDLGPALARRQDAVRRQRQGGVVEGQPRRPEPAGQRGHDDKTREYIAGLFQGTLSTIPVPGPKEMAGVLEDGLRVQPAPEVRPARRDRPRARARATRSRRRWATRRRSPTASTSSRRTGPTTRSSATCPRATASRASASSPSGSRRTTTPWPASSSCSTTFTSTARSRPTATSGRWGPTPATSSSGPGR